MNSGFRPFIPIFICVLVFGCNSTSTDGNFTRTESSVPPEVKFTEHSPEKSGFNFSNILNEAALHSPFNYINLYNGGGVAIGDINNDGLQDVMMTGNTSPSKLFLNKGDFKFEDITVKSGVNPSGWCTGAVMADVNNDGWTDIYICRSYYDVPAQRENLFYLNNQDGTFTEKAAELGINDNNWSITAAFFDYDLDGDLDLVVGNHPRFKALAFQKAYNYWINPVPEYSNKLFRNDDGKFTDVTSEAGLLTYSFTLGILTTDWDNDGWTDIYFSVDHDRSDRLYRNNGDGTFTDIIDTALKQNSRSSMGIDAGDINHDPYPDIMVVEMLAEDHFREKTLMGMQTVDRFEYLTNNLNLKYYQMRNFLHLNNGNNTFSDIGQMANMHRSDWSWGSLFMDADNDGWQDIFIPNGYWRDIYQKDNFDAFNKKMATMTDMNTMNRYSVEYSMGCPQTKIPNYFFQADGDMTFTPISEKAGFGKKTISTGSAYADLDNDGDLDLIVSHLGEPSSLYENVTEKSNNFLRINAKHNEKISPICTKGIIRYGDDMQSRELITTRGYQSSCEPFIHFGLGDVTQVDEVEIIWPDGKKQILKDVKANQILTIDYNDAKEIDSKTEKLYLASEMADTGLDFVQNENYYNDYDDQILLPHKMSEQGPYLAKGDVNGDGLEDIFFSSPTGQAGALYIQDGNGKFVLKPNSVFEKDKNFEDGGSAFFDADGDGDSDLLVAGGGYEFEEGNPVFQPRLYLNDGQGNFSKSNNALPNWLHSSSCVEVTDFEGDGDLDVFMGGRLLPKKYPYAGTSGLFLNDGKGKFTEHLAQTSSDLANVGMVKDAIWTDLNADEKPDLVVVGEWMPVSFWIQENGILTDKTEDYLPMSPHGWWNTIHEADLDGNGLKDFVVGNLGLNYKYKASPEKPFLVYGDDFDKSGSCDIVLGTYYGDTVFPVRGRQCSSEQIPDIKKKFPTYEEFARADINQVYGDDLKKALHYKVDQFATVIIYQDEPGKYSVQELPLECQIAPTNGIVTTDLNGDGNLDLILGGNMYQSEIETGRADGGTGVIVINEGNRRWRPLKVHESGLYIANDVKAIELLALGKDKIPVLVVANNRAKVQVIELSGKPVM